MSESSSDQTDHSLGGWAGLAEAGAAALAAPPRQLPKALRRLLKLAYVVAGLFLFILALRMLSKGAGGLGPFLKQSLGIENAVNTLGFGWLFAYGVLSGSPVASIALSFLDSGVITPLQTFTMITGSRLGASFIVLVIGFIYYLRGRQRAASISIGILSLSVTATTYLPALAIGYWLIQGGVIDNVRLALPTAVFDFVETLFDPVVAWTLSHTNNLIVFVLGVGVLLLAFNLLDRALPQVNAEHNAFGRVGGLIYRPMAMFFLGAFVTSLTLSVSVSLSILVPLSARGFIRRENTLPYIMGANITTFIDTLIASLLIKNSAGFTVVLAEIISIAVISLLILLFFYRPYERAILRLLDRVVNDTPILIMFMVIMVVTPVLLLLVF
jgi:Na+/phosphate symporter